MENWQNNIISNNIAAIKQLLGDSKTIAVVGMTAATYKPSYYVPKYMLDQGYKIIPINPKLAEIEGIKCFADLLAVPKPVDIVQIFRRSEDVFPHAEEALELQPKAVWLQSGIINNKAAELLAKNGIQVIMDRCMYVDHRDFFA
ncbi:MAG: CoA-binding protein [Blastocatellia bacterium]